MSFNFKIKNFAESIEDLLLKNHSCICCRREISDDVASGLCDDCFKKIKRFSGCLCEKCGDFVVEGNKICDECKNLSFAFDKNFSFAVYDEISGGIVKNLKYNRKKYLAKYIGLLMSENSEVFEGVDAITFVPISKVRLKERGFNQAEEIAKEVCCARKIPMIELLAKTKEAPHQAGLSRKERMKNIVGTIEAVNVDKIKGKSILVIDDVFTTGSTLSECARVLKKNGAKSIKSMTFAKTRQNTLFFS